jgi:hypothetical protein
MGGRLTATFEFSDIRLRWNLDRDLPLYTPRFNIATEPNRVVKYFSHYLERRKGVRSDKCYFLNRKANIRPQLLLVRLSRYHPFLISSPQCTSSYQGASFVSCADANFFVRPASCLFSLCAGISQRVVCGWEFRTAKGCPQVQPIACTETTPRENREILGRRQNGSASRFHRPLLYRADELIKWPVAFRCWLRHSSKD